MFLRSRLLTLVTALLASSAYGVSNSSSLDSSTTTPASILAVCHLISASISSASDVYYPGSANYVADNEHFMPSSSQDSICSVEPGTTADVSTILHIVGLSRTPFAVKGGGHTSNVGFSSTTGVQIAMTRFNQVTYSASTTTVDVGAGCRWDDVYAVVNPLGRNVAGARAPGVGVAGFTLGGGVNYLSNQYGETIDTVTAFELVRPGGAVTTVTAANTELFFALKGGFNNFGIVTKFTFNTFPQTQIWAGGLLAPASSLDAVNTAVENFFATSTDPKATLIVQYRYQYSALTVALTVFYDAPTPPAGLFDEILAIPGATGTPATMDFVDVLLVGSPSVSGSRFMFGDTEVTAFPKTLLDAIAHEAQVVGDAADPLSTSFNMFMIWQNLPNYLQHGAESAWPADRSVFQGSINSWALWTDPTHDADIVGIVEASGDRLAALATSLGQDLSGTSLYPNIVPANTPLRKIYGGHLPRLRVIKNLVDPLNVMGLAGGFKF
ncbi:FAD-binding domain-containing protein [Auriscalpium vulgare]|uniref:FAD-binding domain-containing protein n=1 Tax=Auriscalpium vulgare TaxID=40419 RepID=A0ACB8RDR0_9AGAM|nr:FAD-binding domain-containing protein [Auriscalpium vulgare]